MKESFPFGEIVKSTRTSGTWEETRQRGAGKKGELSFLSDPEFNQKAAIIQTKLVTSKTLNVPSFNKRCSNTDWL